jgi:hypothetical protein
VDHILAWEGWRHITITACAVTLAGCALFIVAYQAKVGWLWWRLEDGSPNRAGRYLMGRKLVLGAIAALILANRIWPGWEWRAMVTAVLMSTFALQTFIPYRLLMKAQDHRAVDTVEAPQHEHN